MQWQNNINNSSSSTVDIDVTHRVFCYKPIVAHGSKNKDGHIDPIIIRHTRVDLHGRTYANQILRFSFDTGAEYSPRLTECT